LEAVVTWSYDLLSEGEQHAFARLAVFPDHFTLEIAEAVVPDPPSPSPMSSISWPAWSTSPS
jgi:predicted ATPase